LLAGSVMISALCVFGVVECFVRFVLDPAFTPPEEEVLAATSGASSALHSAASPVTANRLEPTWSGTESGLSYHLTEQRFIEMQCLLAWGTCLFSGLGSEFVVGYELMVTVKNITPAFEHGWFVAQFLFPIMIHTAILLAREHNAWALVFGCMGMWKFGFPETLTYFLHAWSPKDHIHRVSSLLNALGTLTHHSASMLFICIFTTGAAPMTRPLIAGATPLVVQHLAVSLKYFSMPMYAFMELLIEIYWEWEVMSGLELLYHPHQVPLSADNFNPLISGLVVRCVSAMVLAHWFYWAAAIIDSIRGTMIKEDAVRSQRSWQGHEVAEWKRDIDHYHESRDRPFKSHGPTSGLASSTGDAGGGAGGESEACTATQGSNGAEAEGTEAERPGTPREEQRRVE